MTDTEGNPASDTMPINSSRNIVAILTDSGGTPMPNQTIKFSATLGTLQASSDMTNEKGEAKVSFSSGSVADKGKITAEFGKSSTEMEFTVTGSAINISLQVLDKDAAPVTQLKVGDTGRLEAKLTDAENAPLVSKLVTFSLDQDIAEISPDTKTALTDSDGKASVSLTASKTGAGKATASYENYSATTVLEVNAEAATARQHQTSFKTEIYPDFQRRAINRPAISSSPMNRASRL
jgi:adhesin/invasin